MNKIFALLLSLFVLMACNLAGEDVYVKSLDGNWSKSQKLTFDFDIKDAQTPKNIIFVVRNNNDYPYANIRVFSSLSSIKDKKVKQDTLNYILTKPNGEWLGSGFGETKEILFQYKMNYKFPQNGKYRIVVQHAMRKDKLIGVEDFGIKIEQAKP